MKRREFIRGAAAISAGILVERGGSLVHSSLAADSRIEVLLGEEIGTISPTIYGHFAEHLGGVVYDGIWVGQNSRVPNTGIGPRAQRPRRTNFWADAPEWRNASGGPWKFEPNHFGTNEFLRFCQLAGAEASLNAAATASPPRCEAGLRPAGRFIKSIWGCAPKSMIRNTTAGQSPASHHGGIAAF